MRTALVTLLLCFIIFLLGLHIGGAYTLEGSDFWKGVGVELVGVSIEICLVLLVISFFSFRVRLSNLTEVTIDNIKHKRSQNQSLEMKDIEPVLSEPYYWKVFNIGGLKLSQLEIYGSKSKHLNRFTFLSDDKSITIENSLLVGANFLRARFCNPTKTNNSLILQNVNLENCDFRWADLRNARFSFDREIEFGEANGSNVISADFYGADLRGAEFRKCDLSGSSGFADALLNGAIFRNCSFSDLDHKFLRERSASNPKEHGYRVDRKDGWHISRCLSLSFFGRLF